MNKIQKERLYESIMKNVSKTIKKQLNEALNPNNKKSYGYKWCIANGEDPDQEVILYTNCDDKNFRVPYCIVRTYYVDDYYRVAPEVYDYLKHQDEFPILTYEGQYKMSELNKKVLDLYDKGYIWDLEYSNGHVHEF